MMEKEQRLAVPCAVVVDVALRGSDGDDLQVHFQPATTRFSAGSAWWVGHGVTVSSEPLPGI